MTEESQVETGLSTMGDTLDRGFQFASALFEAIHEYGPAQFSPAQKEALGNYLLVSAVEWVKARNRLDAGLPRPSI